MSAFVSRIIDKAPIAWVTRDLRELCIHMFTAFDLKLFAARLDTGARSDLCSEFVSLLPVPFQAAVARSMGGWWRDRLLAYPSGEIQLCVTSHE